MFILVWIRKTYRVLSADASPSAIAFAAWFGLTAGCVPVTSGLFWPLVALLLVFRVQLSSALAFWAIGSLSRAAFAAAWFASLGEGLIERDSLRGFWTWLLNLPVIAWFDLHVYAVLGGAVAGIVVGGVLFWPIRALVIGYRRFAHEKVSQNRFFKWLQKLWLFRVLRFIFVGVKA